MSKFKKGDRVRITIEGFVGQPYKTGFTVHSIDHVYVATVAEHPNVTVEKMPDPLPTTPGSVIRLYGDGPFRFRTSLGWLYENGNVWDDEIALASADSYEVIFDAGKAS